ncbi:hypothetical protein Hanom_Chr01g00042671 [Helianthus anomalus]
MFIQCTMLKKPSLFKRIASRPKAHPLRLRLPRWNDSMLILDPICSIPQHLKIFKILFLV